MQPGPLHAGVHIAAHLGLAAHEGLDRVELAGADGEEGTDVGGEDQVGRHGRALRCAEGAVEYGEGALDLELVGLADPLRRRRVEDRLEGEHAPPRAVIPFLQSVAAR
jgi:hypothetical protein